MATVEIPADSPGATGWMVAIDKLAAYIDTRRQTNDRVRQLLYRAAMSVEQGGDTRLIGSSDAMDSTSQQWLDGLHSSGTQHEVCVAALHALLLRVARHEVSRRAGSLRVYGPELDDIAHQASDDAVMAVRSKAASFRGDSRFTTWAYKFVMFEVSTKMGRHFWRAQRASTDDATWDKIPDTLFVAPEQSAEQRELFAVLRRAIDEELTPLQRRVFVAIALNEVPMDAFARELNSSRNSIYKVLFDARRKLRACLQGAGYDRPTTSERAS